MEAGIIGKPVTGTAFMMGRGMEHWHPDPSFYYQPGAGPLMDMGPYYLTMMINLLGPVRRVQAIANCWSLPAVRPSPSAPPGMFSATPTIRSSCTAPRARCACPIRTISVG
jgi:predicted dehydrogenase